MCPSVWVVIRGVHPDSRRELGAWSGGLPQVGHSRGLRCLGEI